MRSLVALLLLIFLMVQGALWFGQGSMPDLWRLRDRLAAQQLENDQLSERNRALAAEVEDLKAGLEAVEERARAELGMIKRGETFYQVIEPRADAETPDDEKQPSPAERNEVAAEDD